MQGRPVGWEVAISLPAGLPLLRRGVIPWQLGIAPEPGVLGSQDVMP